MKKVCFISLFVTLFSLNNFQAQNSSAAPFCDNEDFELSGAAAGSITNSTAINGWTAFKFNTAAQSFPNNCVAFTSTSIPKINPVAVELFTTNGLIDPVIGPGYTVNSVFGSGSPNGGTSPGISNLYGTTFIRVGGTAAVSYNHHGIEKTFSVTPANSLFRFAYIPVVTKGLSACCELPGVQIRFYNASGGNTLLPCPVYSIAPTSPACFSSYTPALFAASTNTDVFYHPWRIEAVDLSPYIGSTITFKLGAFYCSTGCLKYAYAYLDAQCGPMQIFVNGTSFPAHTNSVTFTGCGVTTATVVAPPDFSTYQWSGPAGFSSTLSTITTGASGVYTLNIFSSNTCSVITKYVSINLFPAPTLSISTTNTLICKGKTATVSASGLNTYTWNVPGNTASINVSPANTTTYSVSGYDVNGCFASASITQSVISCVGLEQYSSTENEILIYPNPNQGGFNIKVNGKMESGYIQLRNMLGQLVYTQPVYTGFNTVEQKSLSSGVYICTIFSQGKVVQSGKLVVD